MGNARIRGKQIQEQDKPISKKGKDFFPGGIFTIGSNFPF